MKVTIYVEGGGDNESLKTECRRAFRSFFERAGFKGKMPTFFACGSRTAAFDDFKTALAKAKESEFVALLVDSEDALTQGTENDPWAHLLARDNWSRPSLAQVEHAHLMVQCMETWFLADLSALESFFGDGFKLGKIPTHPSLEAVSKDKVFKQLSEATARATKGTYDKRSKGRLSFELLACIDPAKVAKQCPHAHRLIKTLGGKLKVKLQGKFSD